MFIRPTILSWSGLVQECSVKLSILVVGSLILWSHLGKLPKICVHPFEPGDEKIPGTGEYLLGFAWKYCGPAPTCILS